jgi:sugar/nucleoside kinase (ribokinase family)
MSLLVVGSVAFDDLETPSGRRDNILGGSASYFSLSASRFHGVQVIAVVGQDFGPEHYQVFADRPIDLSGLLRTEGQSFHWKGEYGQDLNEARTLETHLNVFADFHPVLPESHRNASCLFLGNIDPVLQLDVVRQMAVRPRWIALDTMNFWINGARPALLEVLKETDILLVNETEARALTGERNLVKVYQKMQALGPKILVVKRGEYGVSLFTPMGHFMAPAFPLEEVVDPTGAGDTFAGGFLGYLASTDKMDLATLKKAALMGTIMASFTVEKFGTSGLEGLQDHQLTERVGHFSNMIQLENEDPTGMAGKPLALEGPERFSSPASPESS